MLKSPTTRILADLSAAQIEQLDALAVQKGVSRASLIRLAVDGLLERSRPAQIRQAFGAWAGGGTDGLAYQRKLRDEW